MKNHLSCFLLTFIGLSLLLPISNAQPIPPVRTMEVPAVTERSCMDGIPSESHWSEEVLTEIFNSTSWDGPEDFSVSFRLAWSYNHLFLFVKLIDDINHSWNGIDTAAWEFDNIEIYLQLDTNTVDTSYSENTVQLRFNRGDSAWASAKGRADINDFDWYTENSETGWLLEAAIPWTSALPEGALIEDIMDYFPIIGFDLQATDSDNPDGDSDVGMRDAQVAWDLDEPSGAKDRTEDKSAFNTRVFGYMHLVGFSDYYGPELCYSVYNPVNHSELLELFPNPANKYIQLKNFQPGKSLEIYDATGQLVFLGISLGKDLIIDVSEFQCGLYFLKPEDGSLIKFVKQ